jgi:hypothetical protein
MKISLKVSILLLLICCSLSKVLGQEQSSYKMTLVKVIDEEKENAVKVILKVLPTIEDFKLIVSGRVEYSFGRKTIKTDIQKDPTTQIIIYGDDFVTKAPELSKYLNDLEMEKDDFLLVFNISNIKEKNLVEGYFKYGLWESDNPEIRNEQTFFFNENEIIKN